VDLSQVYHELLPGEVLLERPAASGLPYTPDLKPGAIFLGFKSLGRTGGDTCATSAFLILGEPRLFMAGSIKIIKNPLKILP
jgi:hypothetical protein